ncbi:peptidoglycan/LPS O-acetylase OafA/YrhL [Paraburkholderia bryophila]|uniref:Peptidoglycan/LPS O-acetylase OafA/YrhL n=1 Tax=Paraburkholderia bryophila TaxID=420952 RepID=A0A7Y9W5A9_9BURK|nr:peptidoglycan/LPS O-acetylase OafA/YrhL [Paraburkholderia bryophila]
MSLFFVLSGFILTFTYRDKLAHGGVRSFYEARVARIYPMILLGLLMCVPVVIYLVLNDNPQLMLEWYALKGAIYPALLVSLIAQLLLLNGWLPFSAINQPWNGPSDSVSCEAFFYLLFPFLLCRTATMSVARIGLMALATWLVTGVWIALLKGFVPLSRSAAMIYAMPVTRLAEFVMGIAVAICYLRLGASGRSQHGRGIVLIGVALSAIFILSVWRPIWPALLCGVAVLRRVDTGTRVAGAPRVGLVELATAGAIRGGELFVVPHASAAGALVGDAGFRAVERLDHDSRERADQSAVLPLL